MKQRGTTGKRLTGGGRGLLLTVTFLAIFLLAASSPVQASLRIGIFGGFAIGTFPAPYVDGGTLSTRDSLNSFHVWSTYVLFDATEKTVAGTGPFTMHRTSGAVGDPGTIIQGYWVAKKFLSWRSIGLCGDVPFCLTGGPFGVEFPPNFEAGRMRAIIVLYDSVTDEKLGRAVLTIWCSLPGIPYKVDLFDPMGRGIEKYRVKIISGEFKGLDFVVGRSGTVFVDCSLPGLPCG